MFKRLREPVSGLMHLFVILGCASHFRYRRVRRAFRRTRLTFIAEKSGAHT
jgi:hypothetical protein